VADLTYDNPTKWSGGPILQKTYIIANGVQLYIGMILELSGGYATKYASGGGATNPAIGICVQGGVPGSNVVLDGFNLLTNPIPAIAKGNTAASFGNQPTVIVETGAFTWKQVTLTLANGTLTGTETDVGTKVFAVTSNVADCTNTAQGTDKVFAEISAFYNVTTSTTATYDLLVNSYDARTRGN
jgi:hypothetical protein